MLLFCFFLLVYPSLAYGGLAVCMLLPACSDVWNRVFPYAEHFVRQVGTLCFASANILFYSTRTFCFPMVKQSVFMWWNKVFLCGGTKCSYMVKQSVFVRWNKVFTIYKTKCFGALKQTVHCCELMRYLVISMKRACVSVAVLCTGKRRRNSFLPQAMQDYYGLYLLIINDLI